MLKIFKIVKDNKKSIRVPSTEVEFPYKQKYLDLAKDMTDYLVTSQDDELAKKYNLRSGVGLAAPQTGLNKRIISIFYEEKDEEGKVINSYKYGLINPKIVLESVQETALSDGEGCLSVDDEHHGLVYRHYKVEVKAFDVFENKDIDIKASGFLAIILQHEIDHLNGVLFYDRIDNKKPDYVKPGSILL